MFYSYYYKDFKVTKKNIKNYYNIKLKIHLYIIYIYIFHHIHIIKK